MRKYMIVLIFVFSLLPGALCQAAIFTGPGTAWFNNSNWDPAVPGLVQDAEMSVDGTNCIVVVGNSVACRGIYVGAYGGVNEMAMQGGDITCQWLNIGRGSDPNNSKGEGTFTMTAGTIETTALKIPEQFNSDGNYMTRGIAQVHGGAIDVTTGAFSVGNRIHGVFPEGFGTLEMKPGAEITIASGLVAADIEDDLYNDYITAVTDTAGASAMIVLDANDAETILYALDTTAQQAYNPVPGSWATEEYTLSSQTTALDWDSAPSKYKEFLYFSDDRSLVANKATSVKTEVTSATRPYSVGSLEMGKTYYWMIETQIFLHKYDGQIWSMRVPNSIRVDNFDDVTGVWTDSGAAISAVEDNAGLKYSPYGSNLKITVGAGQNGSASSVPLGSDWTVKNAEGLYVDVYGNDLNDPGVQLTVTLNDSASAVFAESLDTAYDETLNKIFTWKIPVEDFGIDMSNITKLAFSVDNTSGAGDAVVHVANIRLVAKECVAPPGADVSSDCIVDLTDLLVVASTWLTDGLGLPE